MGTSFRNLVVAGVAMVVVAAGTVSAQTAPYAGSVVPSVVGDRAGTSGEMNIKYNLSGITQMTVTSMAPTRSALNAAYAQVGTISVLCTYTNWDVTLQFKNDGSLVLPSTDAPPSVPGVPTVTPGTPLKLAAAGNPDAKLQVAIGILTPGSTTVAVPGTHVGGLDPDGTSDAAEALSLAAAIGGNTVAPLLPTSGFGGRTAADILAKGFAATGETANDRVTFYVNAGLDVGGTGKALASNDDGEYVETIIVTLHASF